MKILVVDDEGYKLRAVCKIIKNIEGINNDDIYPVLDLSKAKQLLRSNIFDFMIIDLNMPETIGDDPCESGGLNFIQEFLEDDYCFKPRHVIILSEYDKLLEEFKDKNIFNFQILHYNASSTYWSDYIKSKIQYEQYYTNSISHVFEENTYDVAIITAVEIESDAVKALSREWNKIENKMDPTIYYTTEFASNSKPIKIIAAQQSEMGMAAAATLTTKLLSQYKPKYIIMVGIAAGIADDNSYGDIIFPSDIWNYSSGKYVKNEKSENNELIDFIPDPKYIQLNPRLKEKSLQNFDEVLFKIKKKWNETILHDLKLLSGPMACGSSVVANEKVVKNLIKNHARKTVGLDMESYGVFYAANYSYGENTVPICIKSICDFADSSKNNNFQRYAAYTSAQFMKHFIENHLDF